MATLQQVADASGVSASTASLALRDSPRVSSETRARVHAAAARLGYVPDPRAAGLATRRFSTAEARTGVGIVIVSEPSEDLSHSSLRGLARRITELGYVPRLGTLPADRAALANSLQRWHRAGNSGVLIFRQKTRVPLDLPEWRRFSIVACGGGPTPPPCDRVSVLPFDTVLCAWENLLARGYRVIGPALLSHDPEIADDRERLAATMLMQARGAEGVRHVPPFMATFSHPKFGDELCRWFEEHRPEAVIGFSSYVRWCLEKGGWRCPRDYAFATLHRSPEATIDAGCDARIEMRSLRSVELLDQLIRERRTGWPSTPLLTAIPARWVDGETAPALAQKSPAG